MVQFGPATYFTVAPDRGSYTGLPVSGQITDTFDTWPDWRQQMGLGRHTGIDIAASQGTAIQAPADGEIVTNDWHGDFGWYLTLRHEDDTYTGYAHLREKSPLPVGTRVTRGQAIGFVGMTGTATGPHLHWMHTRPGNAFLNRSLGFVDPLASVIAAPSSDAIDPPPIIFPPQQDEPSPEHESYEVQSADNLFSLARDWGCSIAEIAALNGITNVNLIFVGQRLIRPRRPQ